MPSPFSACGKGFWSWRRSDPAKCGKFLTNGCFTTAEILFSAAKLYQIAMFVHFKDVGLSGSSLYNTGTKSTERIINEMQGGKTKFSPLICNQPLLICWIRAPEWFNINAKKNLAQAGAKVRQSSDRRKRSFAFSNHKSKDEGSYKYPMQYKSFQEEQKQAHFPGMKEGQLLERNDGIFFLKVSYCLRSTCGLLLWNFYRRRLAWTVQYA